MIRNSRMASNLCIVAALFVMIINSAFSYNNPKAVVPLKLQEISESEAIVIEDGEGDLLKSTDGTEIDYKTVMGNTEKYKELPSFYSSDQADGNDFVTPVRNQGYTALCWDFVATAAVESDLLRHHDYLSANELNLSEKHCAYYNMHRAYGSEGGGIDNDYREFVFDAKDNYLGKYDTSYFSVGGTTDYCLSVFAAWKGPVEDTGSNSIHFIKGQNEMYTENADLPDKAYDNTFCHVQNVYEIPATKKNRDIIKRMIIEHGSVTASVNSDKEFWTGKKIALYDYKKYGEGNFANHEVLIVGWNDEYPAINFITKPSEDGAFICKNSWGENKGASGYFYLSYDDTILTNNNVAAYGAFMKGDGCWYDHNYQYAGFITHVTDPIVDQKNLVYMYDNNDALYGITFTPRQDEKLSAIGYFSMSTDNDDTVLVYEMPLGNPSDIGADELAELIDKLDEGTLFEAIDYINLEELSKPIMEMNCKSVTGGYHTFPIDEPVDIKKGQEYLVVIKPGKKTKLLYEKAMNDTTVEHKDEWQNNMGAIHTLNTASGHSYLQDVTGMVMMRQRDKDFFIKAYTVDK